MNGHQNVSDQWDLMIFKNKILTTEGQDFENFFCEIMKLKNSSFIQVQAYGKLGDGATDGYIPNEQKYYQCYGPRSIEKLATQEYTKAKLIKDYKGLLQKGKSIKEYFFVVNDKFNGIPESVRKAMDDLNEEYDDIELNFIGADSIKRIVFTELDEKAKREIIGLNPIQLMGTTGDKSKDLKLTFKNLEELLTKRIEVIEKLNPQKWWYKPHKQATIQKNIADIQPLKDDIIYQEIEAHVKEFGKGYELSLRTYSANEETIINNLSIDINKNILELYEEHDKDYVNYINGYLKNLIENYNNLAVKINLAEANELLRTKENTYVQIFEKIYYEGTDFISELKECLEKILTHEDYGVIYVFTNKFEGETQFFEKIRSKYSPAAMTEFYLEDFTNKTITEFLSSTFESISKNKEFLHLPHVQKNHVIFVNSNFNIHEQKELKELQDRSNLALHFLNEK